MDVELCRSKSSDARTSLGDFVNGFLRETIENITDTGQKRLRDFLLRHGIHVRMGRGYSKTLALLTCHAAETCPLPSSVHTPPEFLEEAVEKYETGITDKMSHNAITSSAGDKSMVGRAALTTQQEVPKDQRFERNGSSSWHSSNRSPGLQGMMKAYGGQKKYTGAFDDDLSVVIEEYEMTARICGLTMEEKRDGIVIMLEGPALAYYAAHLKNVDTYDALIDGLKDWYTSEEQRARLLRDWDGARLSQWMKSHPGKSEIAVFRYLAAHLSKVQCQISKDYKRDVCLKDQLVAAADLPAISRALREKPTKKAQEAQQRIAALLEDTPGSAGAYFSEFPEESAYFG